MTNYGNLYNERFTKDAPRYSQGAQARTYQDYMRGLQSQKQTAAQTFGNLYNQQANQNFYAQALGKPQGLSGGMETQYNNAMSAQQSQQLGQVTQQRYQAFADIANQESQASQYVQAQRLQEQQLQMGEMQVNQQRYAQAEAILNSPNLSQQQKQNQLENLGLTAGEIERMTAAPVAGPIIGGATSIGATIGLTQVAPRVYANAKLNIENAQILDKVVKGELESVTAAVQQTITDTNTAVDTLLTKPDGTKLDPKTLTGNQKVEYEKLQAKLVEARREVSTAEKTLREKLLTDPNLKQKAMLEVANPEQKAAMQGIDSARQTVEQATTNKASIEQKLTRYNELSAMGKQGRKGADLAEWKQLTAEFPNGRESINTAINQADDVLKTATAGLDDAAKAGNKAIEQVSKKVNKASAILNKAETGTTGVLSTKKLANSALKKVGLNLMKGLGYYFIADSIVSIIYGKGILGLAGDVLKGDVKAGGLIGLFNQ